VLHETRVVTAQACHDEYWPPTAGVLVHGTQTQAFFCAFKNAGHPNTAVLL